MGNTTAVEVNSYFSEPVDARTFRALIVSWALLGLISAGLNLFVCAMVIFNKKLHTMTNYLVLSLSISDLMVAVVLSLCTSSIITSRQSSQAILWPSSY